MQIKTNAKPFIKWAGGKGQLLSQLDDYLPHKLFTEPFTYIEPFVGGGAMLFHMLQQFPNINRIVINDINEDLIKAYRVVKDKPTKLLQVLESLENEFLPLTEEARKEMFLRKRAQFNMHNTDDTTHTANLIFLNKTCFNGLFRVNSKGEFNVPFGKYKHPVICNAETIMADSKILNNVSIYITLGDFTQTAQFIKPHNLTFFYLDPPYRPLTATSSFTSYAKDNFNDDDQQRLARFCQEIDNKRCLWMQSNSDCSTNNPSDLFFERLYSKFHIERVYASRYINSNPAKRGKLTELLIHNEYEIGIKDKPLFKAV